MSTRSITLISCGVIVLVIVVWYFVASSGNSPQNPPQTRNQTTLPIVTQRVTPVQNSNTGNGLGVVPSQGISLSTVGGGPLIVQDFLHNASTVADTISPDYFHLGVGTQSPYLISYTASTQYFNVELLSEPIGQSRIVAEQYFLQHLGVPAADLCRIRYTISAPTSVSSLYGGVDLRFSFCPGAVPLPTK
jgi:hypothetical protein